MPQGGMDALLDDPLEVKDTNMTLPVTGTNCQVQPKPQTRNHVQGV